MIFTLYEGKFNKYVFIILLKPFIIFRLIDLVITNYCHHNKKCAHFNNAIP